MLAELSFIYLFLKILLKQKLYELSLDYQNTNNLYIFLLIKRKILRKPGNAAGVNKAAEVKSYRIVCDKGLKKRCKIKKREKLKRLLSR